jgi:hypothetical protein
MGNIEHPTPNFQHREVASASVVAAIRFASRGLLA